LNTEYARAEQEEIQYLNNKGLGHIPPNVTLKTRELLGLAKHGNPNIRHNTEISDRERALGEFFELYFKYKNDPTLKPKSRHNDPKIVRKYLEEFIEKFK
jgi:hypothetical protein